MIKRKRRSRSETRRKQQSQSGEKKLAAHEKALAVQPSGEPKCSFCGVIDGTLIKNHDATAFICSRCLAASIDATTANGKLAVLLEVLVHRMNQHGFGERAVPQLVDAKPTFNWPELIDLSKCIEDIAGYWKGWQQRQKQKRASEEQKQGNTETIKVEAKAEKQSTDGAPQ
jgi:hypothetical protein